MAAPNTVSKFKKLRRNRRRSVAVDPVKMAGAVKYLLLVFVAALMWPVGSGAAGAATSERLLTSCKAIIGARNPVQGRRVAIPTAGLPCWYYMSAVQNMSVLVDQDRRPLLGICAPPDTTLMDYVRIFVQYAKHHQQSAQGNPAALAIVGLSKAFPCDGYTAAK